MYAGCSSAQLLNSVVGIAKLNVHDDASCIITDAYQPCLLQRLHA